MFDVYDIGAQRPVEPMRYIEALEENPGRKASKHLLPLQVGEVLDTYANIADLKADLGDEPATPSTTDAANFVAWYRGCYGV